MNNNAFYRLHPAAGLTLLLGSLSYALGLAWTHRGWLRVFGWIDVVITAVWALYIVVQMWRHRPRKRSGPPAPWAAKMADAAQRMMDGTQH